MKYYGFQVRAYKLLLTGICLMLWVKPGHGKTLIILKWLVSRKKAPKCLLICPHRLFDNAWLAEIRKFKAFKKLKIVIIYGENKRSALHRIKKGDFHLAITSPDTFVRLWNDPQSRSIFRCFKQLVVDEVTKFKNSSGVRFKKMRYMLKANPQITQRICMTGTPKPNGYDQLFSMFWIVGKTKVFNGDQYERDYRDIYFRMDPFVKHVFTLMPFMREIIDKRLKPWVFQPKKSEYRKMPPLMEEEWRFDLTPKQYALDKAMQKKKVIHVGGETIVAANAGVASFKRLQIASGVVYKYEDPLDPGSGRVPVFIHDYKTDLLEEVVDEYGGSNILVFHNYIHERERILSRFPKGRILRNNRSITDWNKGRISLAVGHPASMAHGLNLQFGGNVIVFYSLTPDFEFWDQGIKRLHRGAITEPVYVIYLIANRTYDERALQIIATKLQEQKGLQRRIKSI
jgi:SNF2 family DNA or RNA helicase